VATPDFPRIEVRVSHESIDVPDVLKKATDRGWGAEILFLGHVRDINHGKTVVGVSYDAFVPHAEKTLREICVEAAEKFGESLGYELGMIVHHRLGRLAVGEASVAITVGSRHRETAYEASRYIIEELKERAAIWKKEHYSDGDSEWLKGHALCSHTRHRHSRGSEAQGPAV